MATSFELLTPDEVRTIADPAGGAREQFVDGLTLLDEYMGAYALVPTREVFGRLYRPVDAGSARDTSGQRWRSTLTKSGVTVIGSGPHEKESHKQRGPLGTGALLSVADLPVGANQVTLTATNSAGLPAADSVTVFVDDDLTLPGPTLSVAPAQIVWNVEAEGTLMQTASIAVSNSGGGNLTWQAQTDASWVTLDADSGGTPDSVTVNADPSGFAAGTDHHAHVILTVTDDPNQSVSVPVDLVIGNFFGGPPAPSRPCVGDCDASRTVTIDELVTGVRIALGHVALGDCPGFDCSDDGRVTIDCLVKAVHNALSGGCS